MKMEPFEHDELSDAELDSLLKRWEVPPALARLRAALFPEAGSWWRRLWSASLRVPLPLAAALAVALALGAWQWGRPGAPPRELVRTERVEVPVWKDRVVVRTVYRYRVAAPVQTLKPVAELRPRIIRTTDEQ